MKTLMPFALVLVVLLRMTTPACAQTAGMTLAPTVATTNLSKVVIVQNTNATEAFRPQRDQVRPMVDRAISRLMGKSSPSEAWREIISSNDVVGLKVVAEPGPNSGTRKAVVAVVAQALIEAGLPASNIIVWDKNEHHLRLAGYFDLADELGVRVAGATQASYDENTFYETSLLGNLIWGDFEFGRTGEGVGRRSFVSKLVTERITKIINITPLMNHNQAGVWGNLLSLALGSVDNTRRFESDPFRLATAIPEIYALPALSDRVVLNIVDALICQYEGEERSLLHYSTRLNELRFSRDPVALDVLSIQELQRQRQLAKAPAVKPNIELYENAALLELGQSDVRKIQVIRLD